MFANKVRPVALSKYESKISAEHSAVRTRLQLKILKEPSPYLIFSVTPKHVFSLNDILILI